MAPKIPILIVCINTLYPIIMEEVTMSMPTYINDTIFVRGILFPIINWHMCCNNQYAVFYSSRRGNESVV